MPEAQINALLATIRDDHAFRTRIFAFADLPPAMQSRVLCSGKTIAEGAELQLSVRTAHIPLPQ